MGFVALALAAPASAADLGARPYTKAPPMMAAIYDWSGFYIGANAGGGWSHNCWTQTSGFGVALPATSEGCHDATGAIAGGQVGYRWQSSSWVFGVEAQGDWANLRGTNTSATIGAPFSNRTTVNALGLFTGQVGYAWNNVLWYVKGGAAVTNNKYEGLAPGVGVFDRATETRWGGTVGTGLEVSVAPNWSVGVEYDHLFMGNHNLGFTGVAPPGVGVNTRTDTIRQDADTVSARVNYRWGGPAVGKY